MSSPQKLLDLIVIGAGPCGIAVGAAARKAGLHPLLLDRGPLCDSLVRYPPYMTFFSTPEKLEVEGLPFVTASRNATRLEALNYYRRVTEFFELPTSLYSEVVDIRGEKGAFEVRCRRDDGREEIHLGKHVVMATGGFHDPNLLGVPGEDLPKVRHYYTEPHPFWRQEVVVVGGSNSAVEAALELFRVGARVTLVHFRDGLDAGVKPWVLPDIQKRIENGEIVVRWRHRLREIRPDSVVLEGGFDDPACAGKVPHWAPDPGPSTEPFREILPNDFVFALTGWKADPSLLLRLGVPVDPVTGIPAHNPETLETPVAGVFIAGVLIAGHDANRIFIENGRWHGRSIVEGLIRPE
jgi:thioredoxin reductase (NADPH)